MGDRYVLGFVTRPEIYRYVLGFVTRPEIYRYVLGFVTRPEIYRYVQGFVTRPEIYRYVLGFVTRPEISPESNSVQSLQKSFGWDYKRTISRVYTHAKRSHAHVKEPVVHVRVRWIIETP